MKIKVLDKLNLCSILSSLNRCKDLKQSVAVHYDVNDQDPLHIDTLRSKYFMVYVANFEPRMIW